MSSFSPAGGDPNLNLERVPGCRQPPLFQIWIARYNYAMPQPGSSGRSSRRRSVVAILDFMAEHPHDRFGLSELARHVGLAKPTCLGIVTT